MLKNIALWGGALFVVFVALVIFLPHTPSPPPELCGDGKDMVAAGVSRATVERLGVCNSKVAQANFDALYRAQHGE